LSRREPFADLKNQRTQETTMKVQPYLMFNGRCEEAINFYKAELGAEVLAMMRFKENPPPPDRVPANWDNKVMHACFKIGDSEVMASDGDCADKAGFSGVTLSIQVNSEAEAARAFGALSKGGTVKMPLGKTFFSPSFGMLDDRFGVSWMVVTMPTT
jgi:PhnB protein